MDMRQPLRHRRALSWIASLAAASVVATVGATAVLAEDAACTVGDRQVTAAEFAADPSLCPADAAPAPAPPAPEPAAEPEPTPEPAAETAPTTDPAPSPGATAPAATDPAATDPAAAEPAATDPAATSPAPDTSVPPVATTPESTQPATATPPVQTTPPTVAKPVTPKPVKPIKPAKPATKVASPATESTQQRITRVAREAKEYRAAPFRDARTFRESFKPEGRIPEQPRMEEATAEVLIEAAAGTDTSWSTLAAAAWFDSRWGDPTAGRLIGERLSTADWGRFGTDGDGDDAVTRTSAADHATTVAAFLADAAGPDGNIDAAFRAYFGSEGDTAEQAARMAAYFEALGSEAIVHGIDDPEVREEIQQRVIANERIDLYEGGRSDVEDGLVDPRVLVTIEFLANRFESIGVTSVISGHGVYTAGGNVSLHSYGQAVDIATIDGEPVIGHQEKDGRTYRALQDILLLPEAMQPAELISLWDLGGASFAATDHDDHIHIGYTTEHE
jgi:hypothetical protein